MPRRTGHPVIRANSPCPQPLPSWFRLNCRGRLRRRDINRGAIIRDGQEIQGQHEQQQQVHFHGAGGVGRAASRGGADSSAVSSPGDSCKYRSRISTGKDSANRTLILVVCVETTGLPFEPGNGRKEGARCSSIDSWADCRPHRLEFGFIALDCFYRLPPPFWAAHSERLTDHRGFAPAAAARVPPGDCESC